MNQLLIDIILNYLPWILSVVTLATSIMAGNYHKDTWTLSILNQFLWLTWIIVSKSYGLIPLNIGLWIIYYQNHKKWKNNIQDINLSIIQKERFRILNILHDELSSVKDSDCRIKIATWLMKPKEKILNG